MSENKDGSGKTLFPSLQSTNDLKRDIWNEAIEAAAKIVEQNRWDERIEAVQQIRELKK